MKIKYFLLILFIFSFNLINTAFAENWIPVKSDNGKVAELDIQSIKVDGNIVKYNIKQATLDKDMVYRMITNYKNKTTAIVSMEIRQNGKQVGFEDYSNKLKYVAIKNGTLNDAVYQILEYSKDFDNTCAKSPEWDKYFKKLQSKIQRGWHPNTVLGRHYPKEHVTAYVTLVIDKDGNILYRGYENNTNTANKYQNFNANFEQEINKFYEKVNKLDPLPSNFNGNKIIVIVKYEYTIAKDPLYPQKFRWSEVGISYMICNKKYSGLYAIMRLLFLPVEFVYIILFDW